MLRGLEESIKDNSNFKAHISMLLILASTQIFKILSNTHQIKIQAVTENMCLVTQPYPILWDPMDCSPPGSTVHGDSPGKNTGVDCHTLLQGIFPTQRSNPGLLRFGRIPSEAPGKPKVRLLYQLLWWHGGQRLGKACSPGLQGCSDHHPNSLSSPDPNLSSGHIRPPGTHGSQAHPGCPHLLERMNQLSPLPIQILFILQGLVPMPLLSRSLPTSLLQWKYFSFSKIP